MRLLDPTSALACAAPRYLASILALVVAAACGDDEPGLPEPTDALGYRSLDELPRERCTAGSMAEIDPVGLYHGFAVGEGQRFDVTARVFARKGSPPWNPLDAMIGGAPAGLVIHTDDDLFLRFADADDMRALHFCGKNADGDLIGTYFRCSMRGCLVMALTGKAVRPLPEAPSSGLTLLGEYDGGGTWGRGIAVNVRVVDGVAYLARYGDGLRILDVRDPAAPTELGHVPVASQFEIFNDVKVVDGPAGKRYALMASTQRAVVVVDVTNPRAPQVAGFFGSEPERSSNVHTLAISAGRAYLANPGAGLDIYDLANPAAAVKLGTFAHPINRGFLHDLYVEGNRAYLNWWSAGFAIVDVSNPAAPRQIGNFSGYGQVTSHSSWVVSIGGRRVALHGDEQYGARLHLVDVTEGSPTFATSLGTWMTRPEVSIHNVMALGSLGIIAYYHDGIRVVDLSDPTRPRQVAWFNTWRGPTQGGESFFEAAVGVDVDPVTRRVYVADSVRGLIILQLANDL